MLTKGTTYTTCRSYKSYMVYEAKAAGKRLEFEVIAHH